ncbi:MAG TPA: cellulase family glycosylhydrolase [Thermoleophilaceae bacterium]|nr:cellulase family glycosylhydrolase [Thermoleophilaceae bacterium]
MARCVGGPALAAVVALMPGPAASARAGEAPGWAWQGLEADELVVAAGSGRTTLDPAAGDGRALLLRPGATASAAVAVTVPTALTVRACGHHCPGGRMVVSVSGREALAVPLRAAYAEYRSEPRLAPGTHRLEMSLVSRPSRRCNARIDRVGLAVESDPDPLRRRVRAELRVFTDWLERNHVDGYVGEVGWPDDAGGEAAEWNRLAERWYRDADAAGLWVTNWAAGEWWRRTYNLASYESRTPDAGVERGNSQASVIEAHPSTPAYRRGVNVAGGAFGAPAIDPTSSFSNANPGQIEVDYHYDAAETFLFLARRNIDLVRVEFRWERLQPALGRPLDRAELARLRGVVSRARAAGLAVILDMHNYGAYYLSDGVRGIRQPIGSRSVTVGDFADVWRRISRAFRGHPGVLAYGLMNEPVDMDARRGAGPARVWERASQSALDSIRSTGDRRLVMVAGYLWGAVQVWADQHPAAWIVDPVHNVRYEAHHYWDDDHSSMYRESYAEATGTSAPQIQPSGIDPFSWTPAAVPALLSKPRPRGAG